MSARNPVIKIKKDRIGVHSHKRQRGMSDVNDDRTTGTTGSSLHQITVGRFSDRCDDCCVSLHRSGHPVDPGVGWGWKLPRVAMTTTIAPPLTEVLNRTLLATWPHMFSTLAAPCHPPHFRHPLIAPAERRWGCPDFGKLIEVSILSIVHWVTQVLTTRWNWNPFADINLNGATLQ